MGTHQVKLFMRFKARAVLLALVAMFAVSAAASASASAASTNNPQWQICEEAATGKANLECKSGSSGTFAEEILGEKASREVTAEAAGNQKLVFSSYGMTFICKKVEFGKGAKIIGSAAPNAGTSEETIIYAGCEVEEFAKCEIDDERAGDAKLTTSLFKSTLVYQTKAAAEAETSPTLTLFEPINKVMFEFSVSGTCPVTGTFKVEGSFLTENVEGGTYAVHHVFNAPKTTITKYFVNNAKKEPEERTSKLQAYGTTVKYVGESKLALASGRFWRVLAK
jgi:hypothetical protein